MKKKVVLFNPNYRCYEVIFPIALLTIAGPLLEQGYEVKLIDGNIQRGSLKLVFDEVKDAICLGMTVVTGPMVLDTAVVGRKLKEIYPGIPIVLGGWHPSLFPATINESFVDVVVKGQGEITFLEVVKAFENKTPLDGIKGISFKKDGKVIHNPMREYVDVNKLPPKPYHLVDLETYFSRSGTRLLQYFTSYGCPFSCTYCCNGVLYGSKWNALDAERVLRELSSLVKKYNIKYINFYDDNFFVSENRMRQIAEGLLKKNIHVKWLAQGRGDRLSKYSKETLELMVKSGCDRLLFGAESGSKKVLALMNKNETNEDILNSAEICGKYNIKGTFFFIFGYPGETEDDISLSLDLIDKIRKRCNKLEICTSIFTPYPGSPAWELCLKQGIKIPDKFEGWAAFDTKTIHLPWFSPIQRENILRMKLYLSLAYPAASQGKDLKEESFFTVRRLFQLLAQNRLKRQFYKMPFEVWLRDSFLKTKHKLVTLSGA